MVYQFHFLYKTWEKPSQSPYNCCHMKRNFYQTSSLRTYKCFFYHVYSNCLCFSTQLFLKFHMSPSFLLSQLQYSDREEERWLKPLSKQFSAVPSSRSETCGCAGSHLGWNKRRRCYYKSFKPAASYHSSASKEKAMTHRATFT